MTVLLLIAIVFAGIAGAPLWIVISAGVLTVYLIWKQVTA